jgi:cbb3-type cytochrome oxidase subunit 3
MEEQMILGVAVLALVLIAVLLYTFKVKGRLKALESRYSNIIDVDLEVDKSKKEKESIDKKIESLRQDYKEKRVIFEKLVKEAAIYDEEIQMAELGFYKPHFDFDTSERYKEEISRVKQEQKDLISSKKAIYCNTEWTVEGSKAKGRTMTNRAIKLTARAFNNECDAAISNTRWNNVDRMEQRIEKAYDAINKMNQSNAVVISHDYFGLKLKELRLAYEYADKKQQEKEEQQEIKRQMREEAKLEQEKEKALKEEEKYNKLLEKAKKDAEKATGETLDSLNEKIAQLSQDLEEAHEKSERAKSMAEQTKRGHVYVISNIGSFGNNIYKIGMTRRLEPLDRVKELGDASVPFTFDVHAMIHSEDAPALESSLHKKFDQLRLNLVNARKEFFRVTLSDIKEEVRKISPDAEFIETAEARDYRESQSIIAKRDSKNSVSDTVEAFPEAI